MIFKPKKLTYKESRRTYLAFIKDLECAYQITSKVHETFEEVLEHVGPGVYIQLRDNGDIYIGEAGDVVSRTKQHIAKGFKLKALSVIPFVNNDAELRYQFETDLIIHAMERGLMLANESKMRWAENKIKDKSTDRLTTFKGDLNALSRKLHTELSLHGWCRKLKRAKEAMDEKDWARYHDFVKTPGTLDLTILVNRYIRRILPEVEATYGSHWWIEISSDLRSPYISMAVQTWTVPLMKARITRATGEMSVILEDIGEITPHEFIAAIETGKLMTAHADLIMKTSVTRQETKRGDVGRLFLL